MRPWVAVLCIILSSAGCQRSAADPESVEPASQQLDPEQARANALAWANQKLHRWLELENQADYAGCRALWAEVAAEIETERDPELRAWMVAGQFLIGRNDPEHGLSRTDIAAAVLDELGLDDHRWSISPYALASAVYEAGRSIELGPELDARIATQDPDVAAYLALERYLTTTALGDWDAAQAVWSLWLARPELARTQFGPIMRSFGPDRRLAPGNYLPEICVEKLEGGSLCTADFDGFTVLELWSTTCKGCRDNIPVLRAAQAALQADSPNDPPRFVSIDPYEDPQTILEFQRDNPMPWTNAWVREADREMFVEALEITSIPILVLIGPDGRILDSNPTLRAENVEARVRHFRSRADSPE